MLVLIFVFVQFAVIALALGRGGRYERYAALVILAGTLAFQIAYQGLSGPPRRVFMFLVDVAMCVPVAWMLWRNRAAWIAALLAVEVASVPLAAIRFLRWALAYLQLVVLAYAVLRRELGPPHRLPRSTATAGVSPVVAGRRARSARSPA